jgi:hypothetical protein
MLKKLNYHKMRPETIFKGTLAAILVACVGISCTRLDAKVYSVVPNANFWQTPAEIAAGIAPAYTGLTAIPNGNTFELNECSSDEMVIPIRGADWLDNNVHIQEWQHNWGNDHSNNNGAWGDVFGGITKINFTLSVVNNLATPPPTLASINAELRVLRAYYFMIAMDLWGNVPLVTSYNTNPDSVSVTARPAVYAFILSEITSNIELLSPNNDLTTYGHMNKWAAWALLARLYLNAQVYSGTTAASGSSGGSANWAACMAACDSVILSGNFSLNAKFFDNFAPSNSNVIPAVENIFVVPFDKVNIGGDNNEMETLHYQNQNNFSLTGQPWNGFCATADYYANYDTSSSYAVGSTTTTRTYLDQRSGQWLIGQQYNTQYNYPPSTYLYSAPAALATQDAQFSIPLSFNPVVASLSDPSGPFRSAGIRNVKYFPEAGTSGGQSNDMVIFRLADVYLMRAEADVRANGVISGTSLGYLNKVRERAYGTSSPTVINPNTGNPIAVDWLAPQATLNNILAERARELSWENIRRTDIIRYTVASGNPQLYFGAARNPGKVVDPDGHLQVFPIPTQQITANANLKQNPGY